MFGKPEDVEGECNAHLYIADDFGDNSATMRCQLEPEHQGNHREKFDRDGSSPVVVEWAKDERCYHEFESCTHQFVKVPDGVLSEGDYYSCRECGEWTTMRDIIDDRFGPHFLIKDDEGEVIAFGTTIPGEKKCKHCWHPER